MQAIHNEHFATALARAMNDWLAAGGSTASPHLPPRSSWRRRIPKVPPGRSSAAPRIVFVQVLLLAIGEAPLGNRACWPIYAAAERHRLPIGIHAGSTARHATTGNGWPSYYLEDYAAQAQAFQAQLVSLICEGVFAKFPDLKVVLIESGFTWLPRLHVAGEQDLARRAAEVPWVDRAPADIIRDHVRFTLQPTDAPPDPADIGRVLDQIGSDDVAVVFDRLSALAVRRHHGVSPRLPAGLKQRVLVDNPLATYPRLRETLQ